RGYSLIARGYQWMSSHQSFVSDSSVTAWYPDGGPDQVLFPYTEQVKEMLRPYVEEPENHLLRPDLYFRKFAVAGYWKFNPIDNGR
ncbi:hypothetical protein JXD38_12630, partial [candidate division WOR-3 bacterium]|nr:hypothetical protein [candidate division WOR-3 bacterium]